MKITTFLQKKSENLLGRWGTIHQKTFEKEFPIEEVASAKQGVRLRCFAHVETETETFLSKKTSLDGKRRHKVITYILGKEFSIV